MKNNFSFGLRFLPKWGFETCRKFKMECQAVFQSETQANIFNELHWAHQDFHDADAAGGSLHAIHAAALAKVLRSSREGPEERKRHSSAAIAQNNTAADAADAADAFAIFLQNKSIHLSSVAAKRRPDQNLRVRDSIQQIPFLIPF